MAPLSPEKGLTTIKSVETSKLIVRQPAKLAELGKLLETFDNLSARVSERQAEDVSGDLGGGGMVGTKSTQGDDGISPRDLAIERIPPFEIVRQKLEGHIQEEVRKLEKQARRIARGSKPGSAHKLNDIYARIRRLNALLYQMVEASVEMLKRLFIRVFIDQQPIL